MPYSTHVLALPLQGTRDARLFTDSSNLARATTYLYLLDLRGTDHASSPPCTNPQLQAQPVTGIKKVFLRKRRRSVKRDIAGTNRLLSQGGFQASISWNESANMWCFYLYRGCPDIFMNCKIYPTGEKGCNNKDYLVIQSPLAII